MLKSSLRYLVPSAVALTLAGCTINELPATTPAESFNYVPAKTQTTPSTAVNPASHKVVPHHETGFVPHTHTITPPASKSVTPPTSSVTTPSSKSVASAHNKEVKKPVSTSLNTHTKSLGSN